MWEPFMHEYRLYAKCPDCKSSILLEDVKYFTKCPKCSRTQKGFDISMWIEPHPKGTDYVCPNCLNRQENGIHSTHDIHVCRQCKKRLRFSWEEKTKNQEENVV